MGFGAGVQEGTYGEGEVIVGSYVEDTYCCVNSISYAHGCFWKSCVPMLREVM